VLPPKLTLLALVESHDANRFKALGLPVHSAIPDLRNSRNNADEMIF